MKFFSKTILKITGLFIIWRLTLLFVAFFGSGRIPIKETFFDMGGSFDLFKAWANWDGVHYLTIAAKGYLADPKNMVLFPGYPILIKVAHLFTGDFLLAAYLVSHLFALGSLIILYKFVLLKFDPEIAGRSIFYFLIFPSSFYLVAAYSESTFIFFAIASFYFAYQRRWFLAAIFGLLVSFTRVIGIVLAVALILEYLNQIQFSFKKIKANFLWMLLIPVGTLFYMLYLQRVVGDPFYFLTLQKVVRSIDPINPILTMINYFNLIKDSLLRGDIGFTTLVILDYFLTGVVLISSWFIYKNIRASLGVYTFLVMIIPVLTGSLAANQRYALAAFPIFILLAKIGKISLVNYFIIILCTMLLTISMVLFINGYWVA